jgi:nitroreductase
MNSTIELLSTRRSAPPVLMQGPAPNAQELELLLTLASRVPDHGKLAPWRFIVFEGEGRARAGQAVAEVYASRNKNADAKSIELERGRFSRAPMVIGVVSRAAPHVKIPLWEQEMSAGAVCMALTIAATALGFRTAWMTEWYAYDRDVLGKLGLAEYEKIAGFIHLGHVEEAPQDRPRPALADIVSVF